MAKKQTRFEQSGYYPNRPARTEDKPYAQHGWDGSGYFPPAPPGETPPAEAKQGKPARRKPAAKQRRARLNPLRVGVLVLCVSVCAVCVAQLVSYFSDVLRSQRQSRELSEVYYAVATEAALPAAPTPEPTPGPTPEPTDASALLAATLQPTQTPSPAETRTRLTAYPDNPSLKISERFTTLRRRNQDITGWLTIDGVLDLAVMQRDNSYYLKRDYLGYHNVTGALFIDESCSLASVPEQIVIHGHNMKTGAMFGILKKYKTDSVAFYKAHPYVNLSTVYEDAAYVIFAVAEIETEPETVRYFNFMAYPTFATDQQFLDYVARAKLLSYYECPVDVRASDRLLTLATCTGADESTRLLVMARQLRADEDTVALNAAILSTRKR